MKYLIVLTVLMSAQSFALRGIYAGLHGGAITPSAADTNQGSGYGADFGLRLTKSYDFTVNFNKSDHPDGLVLWNGCAGIEMRMFRGMADMELTLGVGAGAYSVAINNETEMKFGVNGGMTLDFLVSRAVHIGIQGRLHAFPNGIAGRGGFSSIMVRLGYLWSMGDSSLTLPDMQ
ncbi:MAG: hypothetical protein HYZ71_07770 [Deltaproteobacteria bacterium]|nr:hypothetical protein [Deltaproteobacteria bacterium]